MKDNTQQIEWKTSHPRFLSTVASIVAWLGDVLLMDLRRKKELKRLQYVDQSAMFPKYL